MQSRYFKVSPRFCAVLLSLGLLAGCAQKASVPSETQWLSNTSTQLKMSQGLHEFFDNAGVQSVAYFEQTPWGEHVDITLQKRYYSGSGRECLHLEIKPKAMAARQTIACEQNGQWAAVRPVTLLLNTR